jgi:hypothetical protein
MKVTILEDLCYDPRKYYDSAEISDSTSEVQLVFAPKGQEGLKKRNVESEFSAKIDEKELVQRLQNLKYRALDSRCSKGHQVKEESSL